MSTSTLRAYASRDGAPSVGAEEEARQAAAEATPAVSPRTALDWARVNKIKLPARGRCAAINQARLAHGLPAYKIDPRLVDEALPPLRCNRSGAVVLDRERAGRRAGDAPESGLRGKLRTAAEGWLTAYATGNADEQAATADRLREVLQAAVAQS